jgi:sterol desaturase/sphingolipid hydroxylase (fatty acid hydroxylase superfamily)
MNLLRRFFDTKAVPLLVVVSAVLAVAESRRRLRIRTQPRLERAVKNTVVSIPSFSLLRFLLLPVMVRLAMACKQKRWGINHHYTAHQVLKTLVTFLLLDYSNYGWHVLMHQIPLLWRFHVVHHSDLDLDLTTAFRFHFGELIGSVFYRGAAVALIGASPVNVLAYEALFEAATQFHHTNMRLPYAMEKALSKVIVTPRMHGIHHSMVRQETDSNYSVIFSWWDRLHRTVRLNIPQEIVVIGVPSYSNAAEQTVGFLWRLPFTKIRPWKAVHATNDVRGAGQDMSLLAK